MIRDDGEMCRARQNKGEPGSSRCTLGRRYSAFFPLIDAHDRVRPATYGNKGLQLVDKLRLSEAYLAGGTKAAWRGRVAVGVGGGGRARTLNGDG